MKSMPRAPDDIAAGMALAVLGFSCLSVGDGMIKSLEGAWPGTAVAALRYTIGALGLGLLLYMREGRAGFRFPKAKAQLARGFFMALATLMFFSSVFVMPLAEATAIQFTNPMLTALLSIWLLNERASLVTWIVTFVAFAGVLIVLRPNIASLGWAAVMPVIAALGMAFVMIFNRAVAGTGSILLMQFLIASIAAPFLILAAVAGHFSGVEALHVPAPTPYIILICTTVACTASFSHMLVYMATTRASAAAIAPTVYVQLLVAIAIGVLFYGDYPDALSLGGAALIVGSGLFLWYNNRNSRIKKAPVA